MRSSFALLPALIWHIVGMICYINWNDLWYNPPIHYTDYATHYASVESIQHFMADGQLWGYSPFFHAGFPDGTLFDVDNKAIEVASWLIHRLGLSLPHAFNAVIVMLIAIAPLMVYLASRILGLAPATAGLAQLIALMLWYGDPTVRWMWQGGTLAFASAALGSLVAASGFWRWASRGDGAWWGGALWFLLGALLFWLHPWAFFVLVAPLAIGTLVAWRRWSWRERLVPLLWSGWVLVLNWPWLSLVLRFMATKTSSEQFLQGGLPSLLDDLHAGYTGLRLIVLGLAALGLWRWRRAGEGRWQPIAAGIIAGLLLAYVGVYMGLSDAQPYRFVMPALFWAALPAAGFVGDVWKRSPRNAAICALALSLAAAWPLYQARPRWRQQPDGTPVDYLSGPQPAEQAVCAALRDLDLQSGRVLINDWRLGAWLPACSGAQVVGGPFLWVFTTYGYTNAGLDDMFGQPIRQLDREQMVALLLRYNVRWMVINTSLPTQYYTLATWQHDHPGLLVPRSTHGVFRIYEVAQPESWFFAGTGQVTADYNRLEVRRASAGGLVLKYHWIDTLRAEPALPIRPIMIAPDPVPFIAVDNGQVTDFAIVQDYSLHQ